MPLISRLFFALFLIVWHSVDCAAEQGYLSNGSMTAGAELPAGWETPTTDEGPGKLVAARDTQVFKEGPASLRVSAEGGAAKGTYGRALRAIAGKEVAVTGWAKVQGSLGYCALALICPDAEPGYLPLKELRASPSWQRVNAKVQVPQCQQPLLALLFQGEGTIWLDELAVLPGDRYQPDPVLFRFDCAPLFSFLSWEKKPVTVDGGVQLKAADCKGGAGFTVNADLTSFAEWTPQLTVTANAGNQAKQLRVTLRDADETGHQFTFKLDGLQPGETKTFLAQDGASVREPGSVAEEGKAAGFDLDKIGQVVVVGDWSNNRVDLTLRELKLVEPTPEILAQRAQLRQRLAAAAERKRKEDEAREKRKQELLTGAPHPTDGPDIRHVALVAPQVLALTIQEKEFVPVGQVPYEAQPDEEIRHVGKEEVTVVENGQVKQALKEVAVFRTGGKKAVKVGDLALNAGRLKPEDEVLGQDLTTETVAEPAAYRLVGVDDPAWAEPAAPTQVWWKRKPNARRAVAHQVQVFLKLPQPLTAGKTYRVEFPGVNFRQAAVEYRHLPAKTRSEAVHVSAIGFRPDDPYKHAWLSQWVGTGGALAYPDSLQFQLLDDATDKPVFSGPVTQLLTADAKESFKQGRNYCKTNVYGMNFSAFNTPGRYRVYVEGIGCSYPFGIAPDVWTKAFQLSMKGLLHHRSGIELGPPFTDYVRPRNMHPAEGVKVFASKGSWLEAGGQDGAFKMLMTQRTDRELPEAWGGHMDAGDWDRNGNHPAAMWYLIDLYELYPKEIGAIKLALPPAEANNALPDVLDEVLWNLDLYRRMQASDGGIGAGIESTSHPRPGEASWQESLLISAYAPDPLASFTYAASAAKLARNLTRVDAGLSATYAASARKAWDWAAANGDTFLTERLTEKQRDKATKSVTKERNLAALELWLLTGDQAFHDDFATTTILTQPNLHAYEQLKAVRTYARLPQGKGDPALRAAARQKLLAAADSALKFAEGNAFGITVGIPQLPPMGYVGYLSTPETSLGAVLPDAWRLTGDEKYLAGALRACQFSAGANPMNQALTTGLGPNPVRFPLHIDSHMTAQPAPAGITVYGISDPAEHYSFDSWAYTWYLNKMVPNARTWPTHESYWDLSIVPSTNEYTIHQTIIPTAFYWGFLAAREAQ